MSDGRSDSVRIRDMREGGRGLGAGSVGGPVGEEGEDGADGGGGGGGETGGCVGESAKGGSVGEWVGGLSLAVAWSLLEPKKEPCFNIIVMIIVPSAHPLDHHQVTYLG